MIKKSCYLSAFLFTFGIALLAGYDQEDASSQGISIILTGKTLDASGTAKNTQPVGMQTDVRFFQRDGKTPIKVLNALKGSPMPDQINGILTDEKGSFEVRLEAPDEPILVLKAAITHGGSMKPQTKAILIEQEDPEMLFYLCDTVIQGQIKDKEGKPVLTDWWVMRERTPGKVDFAAYEVAGGKGSKAKDARPPLSGGSSDVLGFYNIPIHTPGARFRVLFNMEMNSDTYAQHEAILGPIKAGVAVRQDFTVKVKGQAPAFTDVFNQIIVVKGCGRSGCHDGGGPAYRRIDMRTKETAYKSWVNVTSLEKPNLKRVKPGDADNSYVYRITVRMPPPPGAPLTPDQRQLLKDWINAGALKD